MAGAFTPPNRKRTEFDVRSLDIHGDTIDVDCFNTLEEAREYADRIAPDHAAVVIERHEFVVNAYAGITDSRYTTVYTTGSADALRAGEWIA